MTRPFFVSSDEEQRRSLGAGVVTLLGQSEQGEDVPNLFQVLLSRLGSEGVGHLEQGEDGQPVGRAVLVVVVRHYVWVDQPQVVL